MAEEIPYRKTPVTAQEMANAINAAWQESFGNTPDSKSVMVLLSQWALETGRGASMHNFNVGNVKAKASGDYNYQYFSCNEQLATPYARRLQAASSGTAKITKYNADGTCWIWFYPKNPGCCFRAFNTLLEGVVDHLVLLTQHAAFQKAWPAVLKGSPDEFSKALHRARYYTADEPAYTKGLVSLFNEFTKKVSLEEVPLLSPIEKKSVEDAVALSLRSSATSFLDELQQERLESTEEV